LKPRSLLRTAAWILGGAALSIAICVPLTVLYSLLLPNSLNKEKAIGYGILAILMAFATSCFGVGVWVGKHAGSAVAICGATLAGFVFACFWLAMLGPGGGEGFAIGMLLGFALFGALLGLAGGALGGWWSSRSPSV
jgi:hypothetical protein